MKLLVTTLPHTPPRALPGAATKADPAMRTPSGTARWDCLGKRPGGGTSGSAQEARGSGAEEGLAAEAVAIEQRLGAGLLQALWWKVEAQPFLAGVILI
jgi:hypothetical protein